MVKEIVKFVEAAHSRRSLCTGGYEPPLRFIILLITTELRNNFVDLTIRNSPFVTPPDWRSGRRGRRG